MSKEIKFNINQLVKVKLTKKGYDILVNEHNSIADRFPKMSKTTYRERQEQRLDIDGYATFQLHHLMSVFGNYMYPGGDIPFETEIIIIHQ